MVTLPTRITCHRKCHIRTITVLRYRLDTSSKKSRRVTFFDVPVPKMTAPSSRAQTANKMSGRKTMTGREKSKSAIASERKNMECASDYVSFMEDPRNPRKEEPEFQRLARVLKPHGGGRLEVQFADGTTEKMAIAKKIRFHGRAATKGDQLNCMSMGDLVIVDGGFIFGKLIPVQVERVEAVFNRKQMEYPQGFFAKTAVVEEQGVDDIVEWDYSAAGDPTDGGSESNEEDVITMGPTATGATKPAKAQAAKAQAAKADEWTGRRGGKREDTGELDIDDI